MLKLYCIFCGHVLSANTAPEHVLLNALGGRKTTTRVDCSNCNLKFGSTIDSVLSSQVAAVRNLVGLEAGSGTPPPGLRNLQVGQDVYHLQNDGSPRRLETPFAYTKNEDGTFRLRIVANSVKQFLELIPHAAAMCGISKQFLMTQLLNADLSFINRPLGEGSLNLSFGGPDAIRSMAKSCLVLWATIMDNSEVISSLYDKVRSFVNGHQIDSFLKNSMSIETGYLPSYEVLVDRFGPMFNLIYVKSDRFGRVIGYFNLYNLIGWKVVLAESGGTPNRHIGLCSNPMEPKIWSDNISDEFYVDFEWLNDFGGLFDSKAIKERFSEVQKQHSLKKGCQEISNIIDDVCQRKYNLLPDQAIPDEIRGLIFAEISDRVAHFILRLPHEVAATTGEIADILKNLSYNSK